MKRPTPSTLLLLPSGLAGAVGTFVMTTVLMSVFPDSVIVAWSALGAAVLAFALAGRFSLSRAYAEHRLAVLLAAIGGVAAFWAAPLLALSQRASDAPPGSEVLFFTTSAWGLIVVASGFMVRRTRPPYAVAAAALLAVLGGATLLANWERPSSFSPFVRFPEREVLMLVAGVLFAAGVLAVASGCRALGVRRASLIATAAAFAVGAVVSVPALPGVLTTVANAWPAILVLMVSSAAFTVSWIRLSHERGAAPAAGTLFLVPAGLTLLTVVERLTGVRGPDPIVWPGAAAGIALAIVGTAVMLIDGSAATAGRRVAGKAVAYGAIAAVALAGAGLFTAGMNATVAGALEGEYRAEWTMMGAETAAGWLALTLALLALAAAVDHARGRRAAAIAAAVAVLLGAGTYPSLASTPLRTATRWIPADVQQTYGTEYARLTFAPVHDPVRLLALAVAVMVTIAVIIAVARSSAGEGTSGGAE